MALEKNVWIRGTWYGPSYPGSGNPPAAELKADPGPDASDGPPPLAGKGSGKEAWAEYAERHGVGVDSEMTRDQIVDACRQADVPVE